MKSKNIAQSGIIIALTLIILYSSNLLPISTLSILTLASCLIPICILRTSIKNAILVYIACSILSFLIVPLNIALLYTLFFGIYGLIKAFIEKLNKRSLELVIKLCSFNILVVILYFISSSILTTLNIKMPLFIIWIISQAAFILYDYALTLIISYYLNKLHKRV